ncbi:MAG: hypothetical protein WHS38_08775 [Thermodesulforhabdaceae bacterium]
MILSSKSIPSMVIEEPTVIRQPLNSSEWQKIKETLAFHFKNVDSFSRRMLTSSAIAIEEQLKKLDELMDLLCIHTCPSCADICCHAKNVFYNEVDLFFLTIHGSFYPPHQTRSSPEQKLCSYWEPHRGCTIPRLFRPYICTWFICDNQVKIMENMLTIREHREVISSYTIIRHHRLILASFLPPLEIASKNI